jgi:transcriptional regulator with XRE-family HTH domain
MFWIINSIMNNYNNARARMNSTDPINPLDVIIASNVKTARTARGLTQADVAEALGLTFQQVQKYESGKNRISASRLVEIARILEMEASELLPTHGGETTELPHQTAQSTRLLQHFQSIPDEHIRESILSLVKRLSAQGPSSQAGAASPRERSAQGRAAG